MPSQKSAQESKPPKSPKAVPEWAKKVKAYREEAGKTQVETRNAIHASVNTVSLVERGIREFTASERKLFFEFIWKARGPFDSLQAS